MRHSGFALAISLLLLVAVPAWGATWTVVDSGNPTTNGTNFQQAIKSATFGDTIVLAAGGIYFASAGFTFPNAGTGTQPITVQSSNMAGCPPAGVRVNPSVHASAMPKLVAHANAPITVNVRAHHWTFVCLDVSSDAADNSYAAALVQTATNGSGFGGFPTYDELINTHDIVFDRLFIHNPEVTPSNLHPQVTEIHATRGMAVRGVNISVLNSWIGSFAGYYPGTTTLADTLGIYGGMPGPMTIQNNQIEAFFNNIFLTDSISIPGKSGTLSNATTTSATLTSVNGLNVGDLIALQVPVGTAGCMTDYNNPLCWQTAMIDTINGTNVTYHSYGNGGITGAPISGGRAQWNGAQPSNITVSQNYLWKNPWWDTLWLGNAKNYIEVKTCIDCAYTGNIFEGACCGSIGFEVAQSGSYYDSNGGAPWGTIKRNKMQGNLMRVGGSRVVIALAGAHPSGSSFNVSNVQGSDITVTNNLWLLLAKACGGNANIGAWIQTSGGTNVTVAHNTVRNVNTLDVVVNAGSGSVVNGVNSGQSNMVVRDNIYNYGPDGFNYTGSENGYAGAWPPTGIVEQKNVVIANGTLTNSPKQAGEMPNSYVVANDAAVGFVNVTAADYHGLALASTSPFKGGASDGTDPGVDFAALDAALSGSSSGGGSTSGGGNTALPGPTNLIVK